MKRISIELVPRSAGLFFQELESVRKNFPAVETINIPDILRYEMRSLECCEFVRRFFSKAIPHIRAGAMPKNQPLPFKDFLAANNIREVLVVLGDHVDLKPNGVSFCSSIDLIKKFKQEIPDVKVYAAVDQYRQDFSMECDYAQEKIDVGASGFFTQPFFDLKLMEMYAKKIKNTEIFWGVSPVISQKSQQYWEKNNKVNFPVDFLPSLDWNRQFAINMLEAVKAFSGSVYFMPIKVNLLEYLGGII